MKKILTVAGLALALTLGGTAMAGGDRGHHGDGHHGMGHHMMKRMFSKLDLTEQQQEEVKSIMSAFKEQMKDKKDGHMAFRDQLKGLIQAETFDEAAVRTLIESKQAERVSAGIAKARMKNQIWNVLTEQQQAKLEEMMGNMQQKGRRMMHSFFNDGEGHH